MYDLKLLILGLMIIFVSCITYANNAHQTEIVTIPLPLPPQAVIVEALPDSRDLKCMTLNLYRESRGDTKAGMIAVARVVMNRVEHPAWADSVCGVIYERKPGCQFSWTCSAKLRQLPIRMQPLDREAFVLATQVSHEVLQGKHTNVVPGATMYHAAYMRPRWDWTKLALIKKVGKHIFYREA